MIDATAKLEHYVDHLAPVWREIPLERRGEFFVPPVLVDHARALGVNPSVYETEHVPWRSPGDSPILVAATQDLRRARPAGRPIAYLGHGIGQSFVNADGTRRKGYSGGPGFEDVALFLAVNDRHAELWRQAYPSARVEVVGTPKLGGRPREGGPRGSLVVASFHWRAQIGMPEAGTSWDYWRPHLRKLRGRYRLALHCHPRIRDKVRLEAANLGVEFIQSFDEVLDRAAVYLNDASSTLWEFAAFGGPVVVLNDPRFRRHVEHGLRFWDCADVGPNADRPADLLPAVDLALEDPPRIAARRRQIAAELYPYDDPATRAKAAILSAAPLAASTGGHSRAAVSNPA
jgi:hypothetical protein